MGKGDKKTRRGKLFNNSYGVTRPRKKKKTYQPVNVEQTEGQEQKQEAGNKEKPE